ncbi:hypothetical protein Tco_1198485 [Tanacetum coccineum]
MDRRFMDRNKPIYILKMWMDSSVIATKFGTLPLRCVNLYIRHVHAILVWSSYARGVIELRVNVEFKDIIMVAIPKLVGESDKKKEAAVASKEYCTTPIAERIDKIERKVIGVKLTLVDDDGKPLHKVVSTVNVDSDSKVEVRVA